MIATLLTLSLIAAGSTPADAVSEDASSETPEELTLEQRCAREVEDLHQFFHDWFVGELPETDEAFERFSGVMHEDFVIIHPSGHTSQREAITKRLREAHGSAGEAGVKIWIRGFKVRQLLDDLAVVSYEEWQERDNGKTGRVSTAILRVSEGTPNGVEWLHLHETWLPR